MLKALLILMLTIGAKKRTIFDFIQFFRNPTSSGYKSDSSHSRSKSHSSRTFSSQSDEETVHRRRMTVIEETKKTRSKKNLSNTEDPIYLQNSIKELNFGTRQ